jgi:hypothetical protein
MKIRSIAIVPILIMMATATPLLWCQTEASGGAAQQQKIAELKQSMAANREQLKKYQWLQTTQVNIKGETKKDEENMCRYGPDGTVQKTPVGPPPEEKNPPKGLKGKIAEKKIGEMQDYIQRLKSLVSHYAPPQPEMLHSAMQAGNESLTAHDGVVTLNFVDYYKPGDKVALSFDRSTKKLVSYNVNTYLDDPKSDIVTLTNQFATLPDGTNYVQETVLDAKAKQIQIITTNSNHTRIGQ